MKKSNLLIATIIATSLTSFSVVADERGGPDTLCALPSGSVFKTHLEFCPEGSESIELKHEDNQVEGKMPKKAKLK